MESLLDPIILHVYNILRFYKDSESNIDDHYNYYSYVKYIDNQFYSEEQEQHDITLKTKLTNELSIKSIFFIYHIMVENNIGTLALFYYNNNVENTRDSIEDNIMMLEEDTSKYKIYDKIEQVQPCSNSITIDDIIEILDNKYPNLLFGG